MTFFLGVIDVFECPFFIETVLEADNVSYVALSLFSPTSFPLLELTLSMVFVKNFSLFSIPYLKISNFKVLEELLCPVYFYTRNI